uniref:DUF7787 domain-containing protein n=1 Tax=Rhizophora mucronata TaxID=61149 RepID=A0A2P2N3I3_RHIMU
MGAEKKKGKKNHKISLEDYLNFLQSSDSYGLTVNSLNQIISMHGFRRIFQAPKKVLSDAVCTLDLVDPSRSTLNDGGISSCAFLNLEDIAADLDDLDWGECCITAIRTVNSSNFKSAADLALKPSSQPTSDGPAGCSTNQPRKRKKIATADRFAGEGDFGSSSSGLASLGSP